MPAGPVAVVAAGHRATARAGAGMLAMGGNAVDAACAAAFAAAVAENPLTGPGAGGFLLVREPGGTCHLLDFFVDVPGRGPDGRRLDPDDLVAFTVPFGDAEQEFHIGAASVAVPGMVPGLVAAVARHGRLALAQIVEPASRLARDGVVVTPEVAYLHAILGTMLTHTPEAAAIYAPRGRLLQAGDRFRVPDLADTFAEIATRGDGSMRQGPLGAALLAHLRHAGGLVTDRDLVDYSVIDRVPLEVPYGQMTLLTNPPPSSGGILIAAALGHVDGAAARDEVGFYRQIAAAGLAANGLRDGAFTAGLHDPAFTAALLGRAVPSRKPTGTTHISVVDADGGMASLSSSCGSGGGVIVPGTGILLNNMLGEADLNPGGFGRLDPGTRMSSMMAPSILVRNGEPVVAIGSAGSNRLRSAILQTVVSMVDAGLDPATAVRRPRIHVENDRIDIEGGVPEAAVAALLSDGHGLHRWGDANLYFGGVAVAGVAAGGMTGAGDPRRGGAAVGVMASGELVDL